MNSDNPLVSIIMPAYNAEKYIAEAIESVLNQTYINWELLITDDGSTDGTSQICSRYLLVDKRIKYIKTLNKGVSAARNNGLERADGEYITFLDADDTIPNYSIKERVEYLEEHNAIDAVHGEISIRDEFLKIEFKVFKPFYYKNLFKKVLRLDSRLAFNPGYLIKRDKLGKTKFKEGMTHAEDILFLITLCSKNTSFAFIPKTMYYYRTTQTSAMSNMICWRKGYLDLLHNIKDIPSISYGDTIVMRIKIARMLTSYHIKNGDLFGLIDIFKILF
jgi:glycosyltransferase involved in cell wall biosynthesis